MQKYKHVYRITYVRTYRSNTGNRTITVRDQTNVVALDIPGAIQRLHDSEIGKRLPASMHRAAVPQAPGGGGQAAAEAGPGTKAEEPPAPEYFETVAVEPEEVGRGDLVHIS